MKRIFFLTVLFVFSFKIHSQDKIVQEADSFAVLQDTLKSFLIKMDKPLVFDLRLNHSEDKLLRKIIRANNYSFGYNCAMFTWIMLIPESISKWDVSEKFNVPAIKKQYYKSYTQPPIIDDDMLAVNYLGHPYQGGYYYNCMRSQGATVLQSSLYCVGQSLLWEYVYEAGMEQPSIQDLITTPIAGIIAGELIHIATIRMSKGGFEWYEYAAVCILNPGYAISKGFKLNAKPKRKY